MTLKSGEPLGVLAACLMVCAAAFAATAPPKTAITHETLWMMKRVGTPTVSPDGRWVVFSVTEPSYEQDKEVSDLWLVAADGSAAPRRLTNTKAAESGVVLVARTVAPSPSPPSARVTRSNRSTSLT